MSKSLQTNINTCPGQAYLLARIHSGPDTITKKHAVGNSVGGRGQQTSLTGCSNV